MLLKKIELENVKSHKKTIIPFKRGLNVFHGGNGSGKSTVLEMIGFILFDFLQNKKHDIYVRDVENDKAEFGTIRLWIIGLNNEPYIIERTIGRPGITVYNALTNKILKSISNLTQFKNWIETQIGLTQDIELDKLFKTSIGIPQGTFINPFQRIASKRKEYFDPILSIKIYENMWNKLRDLSNKQYVPALANIREKISEVIGEIKSKPDLFEKKEGLSKEIETLYSDLKNDKIKAEKIRIEFEKLKQLKEKLEDTEKEFEKLKITEINEKEKVNELKIQLDDAVKAKKICKDTKSNHEKYEGKFQTQKLLQIKLSELQDKQGELKEITANYFESEKEVSQVRKKIQEAEVATEKYKTLEPDYQRYKELEKDIVVVNEEITRIITLEEDLEKKLTTLNTYKARVKVALEKLEELTVLERDFNELITLENKVNELKISMTSLADGISLLQQNYKKLERGECPFFNQQCKNIEEGITDLKYLSKDIKKKEQLLQEKTLESKQLEDKIKAKDKLQTKIDELKEDRSKVKETQRQVDELQNEIQEIQEKTKHKTSFINKKEILKNEKTELEKAVDEYKVCKKLSEQLPTLEEDLKPIDTKFDKIKNEKDKKENEIKDLEYIPLKLREIQEELEQLTPDHELFQTNIKIAEKSSKIKNNYESSITALKDAESRIKEKERFVKKLRLKYDEKEYQKYEQENNMFQNNITKIETQINERQGRLNELSQDLAKIEESEKELEEYSQEKDIIEIQQSFLEKLRTWIREFVPKMRKALIAKINMIASEIYRNLREEEDAVLTWKEDYDIEISTSKSRKIFARLSGGEKMSAALAVRLAILRVLTNAKFAFFDEPTPNLDEPSRINLSKYIYNIKGFEQLFVISHDDSFKRHSEYVIKFTKDENEITHIDCLTKESQELI